MCLCRAFTSHSALQCAIDLLLIVLLIGREHERVGRWIAELYPLRKSQSVEYLFSHYTDQRSSVYIVSFFRRQHSCYIFDCRCSWQRWCQYIILFVCRRVLFFCQPFDVHFHPLSAWCICVSIYYRMYSLLYNFFLWCYCERVKHIFQGWKNSCSRRFMCLGLRKS